MCELRSTDWPLVEQLFGPRGACGGCWCMTWRVPGGKTWQERKGERNKRDFKKLVADGEVHGCLAFDAGEPVGWCCIGPREDFARLEKSHVLRTTRPDAWAVTCFFIPAARRGQGVATALLAEAVRVARARGARALEGYPVAPYAGGGSKIPAAFAWTGVPSLFEKAGFEDVTPSDGTRPIFRKLLRR